MSETTGDVLVDTLVAWGVDTVFGMPGDGINGVIEALRRRADDIRFIQVRHEEAAAFAAVGHAKFTGRLGVCLATSGPGGLHLLNGLYDARMDGAPVLAITGLPFHDLIGTGTQQDVELDKVFADVAAYNVRCMGPAHIRNIATLACRKALAARAVSHIALPIDVQTMAVPDSPRSARNVPGHNADDVRGQAARLPREADLLAAANIIDAGEKVVILAGAGALGATDQLEALAEKTGGVIVKALLGKAAVPDDSPWTTGQIGMLGTAPSHQALDDCDTLVIVGSSFPYIEYLPKPDQARGVQIDIDPGRIGQRFPVEAALIGDSARVLDALLPRLSAKTDHGFIDKARAGKAEWESLIEQRAMAEGDPMKPQRVAWELGRRLADNAIVACDSGTITTWWARQMPVRRGQMHSVSGTLASMACALPYGLGAQAAFPDRQVVALAGDGGFAMLMADFVTCVKYGLPVKVVVINNQSLGQIKWEQLVFMGNPEYACDLAPIDFAQVAVACGGNGWRVTRPDELGPALDAALAHDGPAVVDCLVDTHEPPMPPRTTWDQAKKLGEALARGTPARGAIARTIARNKARELI